VNVLPTCDYVRVTGDVKKKKLTHRRVQLVTYGGKSWSTVGECELKIRIKNKTHLLKCLVIDLQAHPLLSLKSCEDLGLVRVLDCDQYVNNVSVAAAEDNNDEELLKEFEDVFTGLGCLEGEYKIVMDETVRPVVRSPRRVPAAVRDPLKSKLEELELLGVIVKVTEPTNWVSSIVCKQETHKLRICLDPKDLNKAIMREHYQIPTFEEVTSRLSGAKVFSVLDAKEGFWQIKLDEKSSYLTTFNTPFGRYRWTRMPFGISSAPEVWQRRAHELAEDLQGIEVMADDFLCCGFGQTRDEAVRDHDKNFKALLKKARAKNLKLNKKKLKLRLDDVDYMGHILSRMGVKIDPKKVEAITKMPRPMDAKGVSRVMGMVQYLAKFLPNLSEKSEPLRRLTDKGAAWNWTEDHEKTFNEIKVLVSRAPVLSFYDLAKPVTIQCDSSSKGIGSVLLQDGRPVSFSSRAMTSTEQKYAQIEKEMLAIVHSCTRFHHFVYGRAKVKVETDHKPLVNIFSKPIGNAPKRLQRMLLAVQDYDLDVTYKRGTDMYIADTLSRAYLPKDTVLDANKVTLIEEFECISQVRDVPGSESRLEEIRRATAKDESLQQLGKYVMDGWPDRKKEVIPACQAYFQFRDEFVMEDGLIFKGN